MSIKVDGPTGSFYGPNYYFLSKRGGNGASMWINGKRFDKWNSYWMILQIHSGKPSVNGFYINVAGYPSFGSIIDGSAFNQSISSLISKVKGHDFNLAVNTAQGKETIGMITSTMSTLGSTFLDLKHGNISGAARRLGISRHQSKSKTLAGKWLELQYGWLPLLSDCHEAMNAYHAITKGPRSSVVYGQARRSMPFDTASQSPSNWTGSGHLDYSTRYYHEMIEQMSAPRSLGLLDPATVVWESIPYSFVVDWFIPIGDYLSNLNIAPTLTGRSLLSQRMIVDASRMGKDDSLYYKGASAVHKFVVVYREPISTIPVPPPTFVPLTQALSPKRFLNALALMRMRFR